MSLDHTSPEWIRQQLEALGSTYDYVEGDPWEKQRDVTDYERSTYSLGFHLHRQHLPVMLEMLGTGNEGVRLFIVQSLATLGAIDDAGVVAGLLSGLNDSSPSVRSASLTALRSKYDARIIPTLEQYESTAPDLSAEIRSTIAAVSQLREQVERYQSVEEYEAAYTRSLIDSIKRLCSKLLDE